MSNRTTISIIGGSGFIGSALVHAVNKDDGLRAVVVDKDISASLAPELKRADVRIEDELIDAISERSVIINLAAEHKDNVMPKSLYYDVNVDGAKNICNVARKKNINKIIFTSSVAVYTPSNFCLDETSELGPPHDYGKSKLLAEEVFLSWQAEKPRERTLVIIRPTVVFGDGNRGNVYNLLRQISSRWFLMIGDGNNKKSMAYVHNLASFVKFSLDLPVGAHIFNYVDKPDYSMSQLVDLTQRTMGIVNARRFSLPIPIGYLVGRVFDLLAFLSRREMKISSLRIKKFCSNSVFDSRVGDVGFVADHRLEEALIRTIKSEFIGQ